MRNLLIGLVAAGSSLAIGSPASAQYYPGWEGRGGYEYGRGRANPATLHRRLDNVLRSLGGVQRGRAYQLRAEAIDLDRGLRRASYYGLSRGEYHDFDVRIGRLERRVGQAAYNRGYDRYRGGRYYDERYERRERWNRDDD
jgi:hypothetical protein